MQNQLEKAKENPIEEFKADPAPLFEQKEQHQRQRTRYQSQLHANDNGEERMANNKFSSDFYYSAGSGLNLNRLMDGKSMKNRLMK